FFGLCEHQYLGALEMRDFGREFRAITHAQIELLAGRVSALNRCFYLTTSHAQLLRASSQHKGEGYDLGAVVGAATGDCGIPRGDLLVDFAEAVLGGDEASLARARMRLTEALGTDALVDAAAVVANFNAIDRIADATGIPIDAERVEL